MKKFVSLFLRHWARSPVKITLTVLSVALGTGIVVLSFSAGALLEKEVTEPLQRGGTLLYVQNGTVKSDGTIERIDGRPEWDAGAPSRVQTDVPGVDQAVVVATVPFDEFQAGGKSWRVRSVVGTEPGYLEAFGLPLVAGVPLSADDVNTGAKKLWLSQDLAVLVFGSAEAAVGQAVQPPGRMFGRGPAGADTQNYIETYLVAGVYQTPPEVSRRAYGIADAVFPYTAVMDGGGNASVMRGFLSSKFLVRGTRTNVERLEVGIRSALASAYGDTISIAVWEGGPNGASTYLRELRQAVSTFSVSVNVLGLVLLVISSLGIFSVMVVEALGRKREISLERALGASQGVVLREFWAWSLGLSGLGAVVGLVLAGVLAGPVLGTLAPLVGEVSAGFRAHAGLDPVAGIEGLVLALGAGGLLGLLPAVSAVRGPIADTLREA